MLRSFSLEVKKLSDTGEFEGLAAVYSNRDAVNDVVDPGAFTKTLLAGKTRPLLYQHRDPIGIIELTDSPIGLAGKGKLSLGIQQARDVYQLLKDEVIKGLSIGFETVKEDWRDGVRHLIELKLWEISLVTFPANPLATVSGVKSLDHQRIESALQEFKRDILAALERKS